MTEQERIQKQRTERTREESEDVAVVTKKGEQLGLRVDTKLSKDFAQITPNGARAQVQAVSDCRDPVTAQESNEHFPLTGVQ